MRVHLIYFYGACATTGVFLGLWLSARKHLEHERKKHAFILEVYERTNQRILKKLTLQQLLEVLREERIDHEFEAIVKDF